MTKWVCAHGVDGQDLCDQCRGGVTHFAGDGCEPPHPPLRGPDKRSRQRALMHQASIVAGELRIILEQLEELIMTPEEGSDG